MDPAGDRLGYLQSDRFGKGWLEARTVGDPLVEHLVHPWMLKKLGEVIVIGNERVLDAGCGDGPRTQLMLQNFPGLRITAGDFNPEIVAAARKALPETVDVGQLNAGGKYPYPDNEFTAAVCINVFMHLSARQMARCAREMRRVIKPDGVGLITTTNDRFAQRMYDANGDARKYWYARPSIDPNHRTHIPPAAFLEKIFSRAGFKVAVSEPVIPAPDELSLPERYKEIVGLPIFINLELR
ncbi:MAG: class I SAM-dependent methyltransferase [Bdellovibrionota bacterium]